MRVAACKLLYLASQLSSRQESEMIISHHSDRGAHSSHVSISLILLSVSFRSIGSICPPDHLKSPNPGNQSDISNLEIHVFLILPIPFSLSIFFMMETSSRLVKEYLSAGGVTLTTDNWSGPPRPTPPPLPVVDLTRMLKGSEAAKAQFERILQKQRDGSAIDAPNRLWKALSGVLGFVFLCQPFLPKREIYEVSWLERFFDSSFHWCSTLGVLLLRPSLCAVDAFALRFRYCELPFPPRTGPAAQVSPHNRASSDSLLTCPPCPGLSAPRPCSAS